MTAACTCVLVPGAGGDGRYWYRLVAELRRRGHTAVAVTLPAGDDSAGWREYADAIEDAAPHDDVVIVAQSLAGFSAPLVCDRLPVQRLVLLNAMIPLPGETGSAWWSDTRQGEDQREYLATIGLTPEQARDDRILYLHDVPDGVAAEALGGEAPAQSMTPMHQPWPMNAWPDVPTTVLAATSDRLFPVAFQRRIARDRLGLDVEEIPGGHLAALSRPRDLADRLEPLVA